MHPGRAEGDARQDQIDAERCGFEKCGLDPCVRACRFPFGSLRPERISHDRHAFLSHLDSMLHFEWRPRNPFWQRYGPN